MYICSFWRNGPLRFIYTTTKMRLTPAVSNRLLPVPGNGLCYSNLLDHFGGVSLLSRNDVTTETMEMPAPLQPDSGSGAARRARRLTLRRGPERRWAPLVVLTRRQRAATF